MEQTGIFRGLSRMSRLSASTLNKIASLLLSNAYSKCITCGLSRGFDGSPQRRGGGCTHTYIWAYPTCCEKWRTFSDIYGLRAHISGLANSIKLHVLALSARPCLLHCRYWETGAICFFFTLKVESLQDARRETRMRALRNSAWPILLITVLGS